MDESHIKKIAAEATQHQKLGLKLPGEITLKLNLSKEIIFLLLSSGSAMSTAPKELRKVDLSAKMSKSKKKKLKKREKRNQALMEEAMQHVMETEKDGAATQNGVNRDEAEVEAGEEEVTEVNISSPMEDQTSKAEPDTEELEKTPTSPAEQPALTNGGSHAEDNDDNADSKSTKSEAMSVTSPEDEKLPVTPLSPSAAVDPIAAMMDAVQTVESRKPDPCNEIVPDLSVKIADLGNACWVSVTWNTDILTSLSVTGPSSFH